MLKWSEIIKFTIVRLHVKLSCNLSNLSRKLKCWVNTPWKRHKLVTSKCFQKKKNSEKGTTFRSYCKPSNSARALLFQFRSPSPTLGLNRIKHSTGNINLILHRISRVTHIYDVNFIWFSVDGSCDVNGNIVGQPCHNISVMWGSSFHASFSQFVDGLEQNERLVYR